MSGIVSKNKEMVDFNAKLDEVRKFAESNQRWPSTTVEKDATDASDAASEKLLGNWWSRMKSLARNASNGKKSPGMTDERLVSINALINEFSNLERGGIWETQYNKVSQVIRDTGKVWKHKDTDNEKSLRWWSQQKTFYRKFRKGHVRNGKPIGGMTAERADRIEELMNLLGDEILPQSETTTEARD